MKVIVKESGFYAGNWRSAGPKEVEMPEKVAKQFLPPRGHQLALPEADLPAKKQSGDKAD